MCGGSVCGGGVRSIDSRTYEACDNDDEMILLLPLERQLPPISSRSRVEALMIKLAKLSIGLIN